MCGLESPVRFSFSVTFFALGIAEGVYWDMRLVLRLLFCLFVESL